MNEIPSVILSREQLYNEIWEIAVTGVAEKYNIPYAELIKCCKENDIPIPPSGYWTKIRFGKPVIQTPLPESTITEVSLPDGTKPKRSRKRGEKSEKKVKPAKEEKPTEKQPEPKVPNNNESSRIAYRTVQGQHNVYEREKLYEEVWSKSVVKVAAQYGVSDVAIHKICKTMNIPVPPRGYWSRLRAGEKMKKTPLPPTKGITRINGTRTFEGEKIPETQAQKLDFLPESERQVIILVAQHIVMTPENAPLHKKIAAYRSVVKEWNRKDTKSEGAQRNYKSYYNRPPFLAGVISNESLPRVYRILDALYRQVERLGGVVNDDLSLLIRNEHVIIEVVEAQDEVKHELTKQEAQQILIYEDAKRRHTWAAEPQIRKYDYVFNGRLRINIRQSRYFRDTDNINVESRLGDMLIDLYEQSEVVRREREAKEEAERKREEEARLREERRNRYNEEVEQTIVLENLAMDYEKACRIRAYIKAVEVACESDELDDETAAWIDWAKKKADWFDPIIAREDEVLGERDHEESEENKALKKLYRYW